MIDVTLQPFGRSLLALSLGVMKHQAMNKQKVIEIQNKYLANVEQEKKKKELFEDLSFDLTSRMIDKRYKTSKQFLQSGVASDLTFKKSTTQEDRNIQYVVEKNLIKARTSYNKAASNYNKHLANQKIVASFKLIDIKKVT